VLSHPGASQYFYGTFAYEIYLYVIYLYAIHFYEIYFYALYFYKTILKYSACIFNYCATDIWVHTSTAVEV
jgi:hypothetical protein